MGVIAEGHREIERLAFELLKRLRILPRYVDSDLPHDKNGMGTEPGEPGPCAESLKTVSVFCPEKTFRHLGTGGISGADEKDLRFCSQDISRLYAGSAAICVLL